MKYLIVGLGNVGDEYRHTKHNIGFDILDAFAEASNVVFEDKRFGAVAELRLKGRIVTLLKPNTYMNLSGNAVRYWLTKTEVEMTEMLVLCDDLALPFGTLRIRAKGSDGGHNGLGHINQLVGSDYPRLRFGIGHDFREGGQVDWVLGHWNETEQKELPALLTRASDAVRSFILQGVGTTMNQYNTRKEKKEEKRPDVEKTDETQA